MAAVSKTGVSGTALLTNATVPACLIAGTTADDPGALLRMDLEVADGRLTAMGSAGSLPRKDNVPVFDLDGGLVLPNLVDLVCLSLNLNPLVNTCIIGPIGIHLISALFQIAQAGSTFPCPR